MAKIKRATKALAGSREPRAKLTAQESLRRMQEFNKRKEPFIAVVRKGKDRSLSA